MPHPCDFFLSQGWETTNTDYSFILRGSATQCESRTRSSAAIHPPSARRCWRWSDSDGRDVPSLDLNDRGVTGNAIRKFGRQFGRLARCQLDPVVGPEDGGDQASGRSARGGTDLKRKRARRVLEPQANRVAFDFGVCFHLRLRQAREGRQIFMAGCRSARVIGLVPVKCGERSRNPVEVSAQTLAGGIGESQIDEKDALRSLNKGSRE